MAKIETYLPERVKAPPSKTYNFRLRDDTKERLGELADEKGVSRSAIIHALIDKLHDETFES